tara:strand:+ start:711 stop:1016 length:306 start_codon:yes stop_codon:yes gene_type:complete
MSEGLEKISYSADKLVKRLEKRFPHYDFSQPAPRNFVHMCNIGRTTNERPKEYATDMDGNDFCIKQYKEVTEDNWTIYKIKTCEAIIRTKEQKELYKKGQF